MDSIRSDVDQADGGKRPLGLLDVTCLGINAVVGSSIFLFPGRLFGLLGPAAIVAFGLTGLLLISVGLCFAEAASLFDRAGGPYAYAREAFGDLAGFGIGWMCWITVVLGWAAVSNAIAVYLGHFDPALAAPTMVKATAAGVIVLMGALNYRGVKWGAWASNFFTAAKLLPLAVFVLAALPQAEAANFTPFAPQGWAPLGPACFLAYFAFQGFETVPVPAGEVHEPRRTVPLAVVASILLAAALYMLVQAAAVGVFPGLAGSERPLADAAAAALGPWGAGLVVLGAVFSTTGYNAGSALTCPRYLVALAADGHLPAPLAAAHPRFGTPHRAVALTTGVTLLAAMALDFNKLVDFSNVVVCVQYIATCAAVLVFRRKPLSSQGFRLPFGPLFPIVGILSTCWLGLQGGLAEVGWSFAMLLGGFALRAVWRSRLMGGKQHRL